MGTPSGIPSRAPRDKNPRPRRDLLALARDDDFRCYICGRLCAAAPSVAVREHRVNHVEAPIAYAHKACNSLKGDLILPDLVWYVHSRLPELERQVREWDGKNAKRHAVDVERLERYAAILRTHARLLRPSHRCPHADGFSIYRRGTTADGRRNRRWISTAWRCFDCGRCLKRSEGHKNRKRKITKRTAPKKEPGRRDRGGDGAARGRGGRGR